MGITAIAVWDHDVADWVSLLAGGAADPPPPPPPPPAVPTLRIGTVVTNLSHPTRPGVTPDNPIVEASGGVCHPTAGTVDRPIHGIHCDSGNPAEIYWCQASATSGRILLTQTLDASNQDWEDITLALGPAGVGGGLTHAMVANVGNATPGSAVALHRWALPAVTLDQAHAAGTVAASAIDTFTVPTAKRPSGDCEAITQDPLTGDVFWLAKTDKGASTPKGMVRVFVAAGSQFAGSGDRNIEFAHLCDWKLNREGVVGPTGADIAADGSQLVVGNYQEAYTVHRDAAAGETMQDAITRAAASPAGYDSYTLVGATGTREAFWLSRDKLRLYTISDADSGAKIKYWDCTLEGAGSAETHYTDLGPLVHAFSMDLGDDADGWNALDRGWNANQGPRVRENVVNAFHDSVTANGRVFRNVKSIQVHTRTFAAAGLPDGATIKGQEFDGTDYVSGMLQNHAWNRSYGDYVLLMRRGLPPGSTTSVNTRDVWGIWGEDVTLELDVIERGGAKADLQGGAFNDHWDRTDNSRKHHIPLPTFDATKWGEVLFRWRLGVFEVWWNGTRLAREADEHVWDALAFLFFQTAIEGPGDSATCTPFWLEIAGLHVHSV